MAMKPIFLHAGFRSGSTYFWNVFRRVPSVRAFYEPFHEKLATMTREEANTLGPKSWVSGHFDMAPYFKEYLPLIRPTGGVQGFEATFSYGNYSVNHLPLPDQRTYIENLLNLGEMSQAAAVLGFCRSLGRVEWLKAQFPEAIHVLLIRNPLQQWASGMALFNQAANAFFITRPLEIAQYPGDNLYLNDLRPRILAMLDRSVLTGNELYEVFLQVWGATTLAAMPFIDLLVDIDQLSSSRIYQNEVVRQVENLTQVRIDCSDCHIGHHQVGNVVVDAPGVHRAVVPSLQAIASRMSERSAAVDYLFGKIESSLGS